MFRSALLAVFLVPLALSAQIVSPNLELGPERPVATPADVPDWAQLDSIVPDRNGFIVFWSRLSNGVAGAIDATLMARRVDNAGLQVTSDQQIMPPAERGPVSVSRRNDGSLFLAWGTRDGIFVADADSSLALRGDPARIAPATDWQPATACNSAACVAVWNDATTAWAAIVRSTGSPSPVALPGTASTTRLAAAATGDTFAVAYSAVRSGFLVLDQNENVIANEVYEPAEYGAALAATPNGYVTARLTPSAVRVTTKDTNGADIARRDIPLPFQPSDVAITPTAADPLVIVSHSVLQGIVIEGSVPTIRLYVVNGATVPIDEEMNADAAATAVFNGSAILAGWTSFGYGFQPIAGFYRAIDPAAPDAGAPVPVATRPAQQVAAALARTETTELVVWTEAGLNLSIKAAVRPAGSDALAQPITLQAHTLSQFPSSAATDGRGFAVMWVWSDFTNIGIRAALIDSAGSVTHTADINGSLLSNITWFDGDYIFVTFADSSVRLNRLSRDGTITSTEIGKDSYGLRVAAGGAGDRLGLLYAPDPNLFFRILDRDGSMLAEQQLPPLRAVYADLAAQDGQFLAAIRTYDAGRLVTLRFGSDGKWLDAAPLELDDNLPMAIPPMVVERSDGWLVVWHRSDGSSRGVLVWSATGLPGSGFTIAPADAPVSAIAASSSGSMTMLSTKATASGSAYRVVTRDLLWHTQPKRRSIR